MSDSFKLWKSQFGVLSGINNKIWFLEEKIVYCSNKYYDDNSSPITDWEFDQLCEWLKNIDPNNELLVKTGFGYEIGEDGIEHPYHPIEGISDKRNITEGDVVNNGECKYGAKLDGCSVEHYYKNGVYYMSITRGKDNGIGKDVTVASRKKVPHEVKGLTGYVRVEGVVSYTNFRKFPEGKRIRNAVSGVVGAKTLEYNLLELIDFVAVSVYNADEDMHYHPDTLPFLEYTQDYKTCPIIRARGDLILDNELLDSIRCDYPVDGFVCYKDNDILCAYKYPNEFAYPKVLSVESKTQPTGKIFPSSIHIEPTEISDCVTSKVTGKSGEAIINGKLGPGAIIEIVRAGEVVPNWTGNVIKESDDVWEPHCSHGCDDKYIKWVKANCYCTNPDCPSVLEAIVDKTLRHFAPKGFSNEMSEMVINHMKNWTKGTDLNILEMFLEYICIHYRGWNVGTAHQKKLIDETFKVLIKKEMTLYDLVTICSIEAFGKTLSKELEPKLYEWNKNIDNVSYILMTKKEFISDEVNNSKARESWSKRHDILCMMLEVFNIVLPEFVDTSGSKGTVCISGKLPSGTKKDVFASTIASKGYIWVDKLKKDTTILICAKPDSGKAKKAKKDGTTIMSESEFLKLDDV